MEQVCKRCGAALHGRTDKVFCCDECRNDWHNERRRVREKELRKVNRILACNWRILSRKVHSGKRMVRREELAAENFNFGVYTQMRRKFPGVRIYSCYNLSYRISMTGRVHIFPIFTS